MSSALACSLSLWPSGRQSKKAPRPSEWEKVGEQYGQNGHYVQRCIVGKHMSDLRKQRTHACGGGGGEAAQCRSVPSSGGMSTLTPAQIAAASGKANVFKCGNANEPKVSCTLARGSPNQHSNKGEGVINAWRILYLPALLLPSSPLLEKIRPVLPPGELVAQLARRQKQHAEASAVRPSSFF